MKTIIRSLTYALLVVAAMIATGRTQSAAQEIRLSDIRTQQPIETIHASIPCQRAREAPRGYIEHRIAVDPNTFVPDLNTLMAKSDEVILAATLDATVVISPAGASTTSYYEVRVIRSWKGSHHAGDALTYGSPGGTVYCKQFGADPYFFAFFTARPVPNILDAPFHLTGDLPGAYGPTPFRGSFVYVLFLRHAEGDEAQLVQGLLPAAGEGMQGIFWVQVPHPTYASDVERYCADVYQGNVQHCDSYLESSKSPVLIPRGLDPLRKKYGGMAFSDFLREVQSVAAAQ